jgi:hypothetical protein
MANGKKGKVEEDRDAKQPNGAVAQPAVTWLTSKQEVADALQLSIYKLETLLRRYPFGACGVSGKVCGRWHVDRADVFAWFRYVQSQELRHPDARRMRPEEPPELTDLRGR